MAKIGINGFGRIGRLILRAVMEKATNVTNLKFINLFIFFVDFCNHSYLIFLHICFLL